MIKFALLVFTFVSSNYGVSLNKQISSNDMKSFSSLFSEAKTGNDLPTLFYATAGLKLTGDKIDSGKVCEAAKRLIKDTDIESVYYAAGLSEILGGNCKFSLPKGHDTVSAIVSDAKATTQDLYRAVFAAKNLQIKVDNAKLSSALQAAMKKDDSAASLSYAFNAAVLLEEVPLDAFVNKIEDCVAQADEIDKKYLQFEGGLSPTAFTIYGIYSLAQRSKKALSVKPEEAVKLANYLVSRKGVQLVKPAYHLLQALQLLTTNKYHVPIVISRVGPLDISSKNPVVKIRITDLLDKSLETLDVVAQSAVQTTTKATLFSKKPFKFNSATKLYELNAWEYKPTTGFYTLTLSATSAADKRLVGNEAVELSFKVTTEITIENTQLAVFDREQSMADVTAIKVASYSKLSTRLEADVHQKISLKFTVKDKSSNSPTKVHQAFVIFTHVESNREIAFVAESDAAKVYSFDVDLLKSTKDFDYQSGKYTMRIVLGDPVVNNPVDWTVADVHLKFPAHEKVPKSSVEHISYEMKPEIVHMFRPAEKRPPQMVSDSFTVLVLVPLLVLFALWLRIGVNVSNFKFSFYTIGFHLGLAGIFGLYFVFWMKLNMFQTLKYLAAIGCFTFLTGNRMLKAMAERRKSKTE